MKIEIDLTESTFNQLKDLSKENNVSVDSIVEGLLIGYGLSTLTDNKCLEKSKEKGCACYANNSIHKCFC